MCITWRQCAQLPTGLSREKTTVVNSKVYCGGGYACNAHDDDNYIVYCYDPSHDKWTTLPPLPIKFFGLGQINSKLAALGGGGGVRLYKALFLFRGKGGKRGGYTQFAHASKKKRAGG